MPDYLTTSAGRRVAYEQLQGQGPGIVFLGGLKSDMQGSKVQFLYEWAKTEGLAFLRFDYSGHGQSDGAFTDGCIGHWAEDAQQVISSLTNGQQILVGSSMGGWISLILANRLKDTIAGLVGIAAAPDFTEDGFWAKFSDAQKAELASKGQISLPSDYGEPYLISERLIDDGRKHLVFRSALALPFPSRFLQGTADNSVALSVATRLIQHADGADVRLIVVKDADHSFSTPDCLDVIRISIIEVMQRSLR